MTRAEISMLAEEIVKVMRRDGLVDDEFLNAEDAARFLGISKRTLYNKRSELPCPRTGKKLMFRKSELVKMLTGRCNEDRSSRRRVRL